MAQSSRIYCFRANYEKSRAFNPNAVPEWLALGKDWQGYRISTLPWVADVAKVLGQLQVEDTPEGWRQYLESLGLQEVTVVACEDFFEDSLYY
ncbi:MAG: hypothetical protein ACLFV6_00530 [Spirulinaceae cyanobacterium]